MIRSFIMHKEQRSIVNKLDDGILSSCHIPEHNLIVNRYLLMNSRLTVVLLETSSRKSPRPVVVVTTGTF